jgi:hypothetical protein
VKTFGLIALWISILSPLLPLVLGWKSRRSLIWYYAAMSLSFDLLVSLLKRVFHLPHHGISDLFMMAEYVVFSTIFLRLLGAKGNRFWLLLIVPGALYLIHYFWTGKADGDLTGEAALYVLFIIYCLAGFRRLLDSPTERFVTRLPQFWFYTGILLYCSGTVVIFLSKDFMRSYNDPFFLMLWGTVYCLLNATKNAFLAVSLRRATQRA